MLVLELHPSSCEFVVESLCFAPKAAHELNFSNAERSQRKICGFQY